MKTFIINIASRTDRWAEVTTECARVNIDFPEKIDACTPDKAVENSTFVAFNTSQMWALEKSRKDNEYPVLIMEDDCVFSNNDHLGKALAELPEDWEVLYGGANIIGIDIIPFAQPVRYSEHLFTVKDAWMTHCMFYSKRGIERILDTFSVTCGYNYDEWLRQNILPSGKSFIIAPQIAYQRASFSDIWKVPANFEHLFEAGNKLLV